MAPFQRLLILMGVLGPLAGLIAAIILLWHRGVGALDVSILASMYALTMGGVTVGFHRLLTHRSFQTVAPLRIMLAVAGSMSMQGPVLRWCAVHRRHHKLSDRTGDPHSPHLWGDGFRRSLRGFCHAHVGWLFDPVPSDLERSVADLMGDRHLVWVDQTFIVWVLLGLVLPAAIGGIATGTVIGTLSGFLWGGPVRIFLIHHATWSVNSVCHVWGSRPFASHDHSANNLPVALLSFGEGWHNNHHAFPTSARHGLQWWQLDIAYLCIRTLALFRLAWDIRTPSGDAIVARRKPERSS